VALSDTSPRDPFRELFPQSGAAPARGKFLSRLFGIFSETIVQIWSEDKRAPYRNLGRPRLAARKMANGGIRAKSPTLDFLFECRRSGMKYVVEQKCEIEYQGYRYFTLTSPDQLKHHNNSAFAAFLSAARGGREGARDWKVRSESVSVDGAILIWGVVTPEGRTVVIEETGLHDVLGLDRIIADCARWKPDAFCKLVSDRRMWCGELFDFLDGRGIAGTQTGNCGDTDCD
jgi:hypothetical protein